MRAAWSGLVAGSPDAELVQKSPEFLDHLLSTHDPSRFHLATARDGDGSIVGVVPLRVARSSIRFEASGHLLAGSRSREVRILGSIPLLPADPLYYEALFAAVDREFEDCQVIAMRGVPTDGFLWRHVHGSQHLRENFLSYVMYGMRGCHVIPLPETVDAYWAKFTAKRRYNLRRQVRMLRQHFGGRLELRRFDSPHQVAELIDLVGRAVGSNRLTAWNNESTPIARRPLESLADRGLLLIYLLIGADRPCAALMGLKYRGVYYLEGIPRDRGVDRFSPGATAVQMAIEDLVENTPIRKIDMGYGTPAYRHSSTNVTEPRASLLLLRRTMSNRLLRRGHAAFHSLVELGKACIRTSAHGKNL